MLGITSIRCLPISTVTNDIYITRALNGIICSHVLESYIIVRENACSRNFSFHRGIDAGINAECNLTVSLTYIVFSVFETIQSAEYLRDFLTVNICVTNSIGSSQILRLPILLIPCNLPVLYKANLNLIGRESVIAIIWLRPGKIYIVILCQLDILVGHRRFINAEFCW